MDVSTTNSRRWRCFRGHRGSSPNTRRGAPVLFARRHRIPSRVPDPDPTDWSRSSRTTSKSGWPGVTHSSVGSSDRSSCRRRSACIRGPACRSAAPAARRWARGSRHPADAVTCACPWRSPWGGRRASAPACRKKSSITSGTSRRSLASADLPTIAERFSSRFASPSSVEFGDLAEALGVDLLDDAALDDVLGQVARRTCRGTSAPAGSRGRPRPRR